MADVEHSALTGSDLHEPKGAASATANHVYVADGAGSGSFQFLTPYGGWRYNDIGTGTTFTTPTAYTLMNVPGTLTNGDGFTTNSLGRLTYTQAEARHSHAVLDISFKHSTGSGQDCYFAVYKNGAILTQSTVDAEVVATADSGNYQRMSLHFDDMMTQNDYYEIYLKVASGNIVVHAAYFFMMGMPG